MFHERIPEGVLTLEEAESKHICRSSSVTTLSFALPFQSSRLGHFACTRFAIALFLHFSFFLTISLRAKLIVFLHKPYITFAPKPTLGLDGTAMLHLTRREIAHFFDLNQMEEKQKQQLYEIADVIDLIVDTRLKLIDYYLSFTFSDEQIAFYVVLEALSDGKAKTWTELKGIVNLSTATLSRKLKMLTRERIIKRKVIPAFPPKTIYELDLRDQPKFREYFLNLGNIFKTKYDLISRLIWFAVNQEILEIFKPKTLKLPTTNIYNETLGHLFLTLIQELDGRINSPPTEHHPSWIPLLTTISAMSIMQSFWATQVALSSPKMRAKEVSKLLKARRKIERAKLEEGLSEEQLLQKIVPNLDSISLEGVKTFFQQQTTEFLPKTPKILKY